MERKTGSVDWKTLAARVICIFGVGTAIWLSFKYLAPLWVILLVSWGVGAMVDPLARRAEKVLRLPRKLCAFLILFLLLVLIGGLIFWGLSRLWEEAQELLVWANDNQAEIEHTLGGLMETISSWIHRLPFLKDSAEGGEGSANSVVSTMLEEGLMSFGSYLTGGVGRLLHATPRVLIFLVVTLMSCFYLSMDYVHIRDSLISLLPSRVAKGAAEFRARAGKAIRRYVRAYVLLLLLTFSEVFVGLLILGQPYPLLIALGVALVDILPIIGAGTVLVPWAVILLILKNYSMGFGLLILYGVVTIVRQIAEPHLVGGSLGIHPLMSLLFMFAGLQLFGFFGLLLGPAAALITKELLTRERGEDLTREKR